MSRASHTIRQLGALLAVAAALVPVGGRAQTVVWEQLPLRPFTDSQSISAFDFLPGEGVLADDPAADSLFAMLSGGGVFLYNPSVDNGQVYGAWKPLCTANQCSRRDGLVTGAGTMLVGGVGGAISRSTDRGRTWEFDIYSEPAQFHESTLPAVAGPNGAGGIFIGEDPFRVSFSLGDGAPGTWQEGGEVVWFPESWGDVPPSPMLPDGRLVLGVDGGNYYTDDFARSWIPSNRYSQSLEDGYYGDSFTFLPIPGHPYGGALFSGMQNYANFGLARAEVHRSDDGGVTYRTVYAFTTEEVGLTVREPGPPERFEEVSYVQLLATPDGALWAGVSKIEGPRARGSIMRSTDQGETWQRADAGFVGIDDSGGGGGYQVRQMRLARDGRLYAATTYGMWRTTGVAVSSEAPAADPARLGVSVRPNPARDRTSVVVRGDGSAVRVVALDVRGREVAVVFEGVVSGERTVSVDTSEWPGGVYVVRAGAGGQTASARLTVAR